ncbi:MAG: DUF1800 domain-containing protein [Cyanobacteriota bacterium]|nr:DUF1800 domain-containing protein [Cyanobacteriota bacterium]
MKKTAKSLILSLLLGLIICLGLPGASYADTQPITPRIVHALNRISYGPTPGEIERIKSIGIQAYIESQLKPESISEPQKLTSELAKIRPLSMNPVEVFKEYAIPEREPGKKPTPAQQQATNKRSRGVFNQASKARLMRAIASNRQLQEVMVDFWFNHFNIYGFKGRPGRVWVGLYERDAIRPHALGQFRNLLGATAHHPAMLHYLDNWQNTAPGSKGAKGRFKGLNENYARELMELHTLGVNGGYTQQDVVTLARIFTGWGINRTGGDGSGFRFDADRHDTSDKVFLGVPVKGGGMDEGEKALDILARHPATARHISYKLAQYFVSDRPPETLVVRLARRFQETNGNIRAVLESLLKSPEFSDPQYYGSKFKTPYQYLISAVRATGTDSPNFNRIAGFLNQLGMPLYRCPTPNGYKNTKDAWLNPDGMIRRIGLAVPIARGRLSVDKNEKAVEAIALVRTLGNDLSPETQSALNETPENMRSVLLLGSPEMMQR